MITSIVWTDDLRLLQESNFTIQQPLWATITSYLTKLAA